MNRLKGFSIDLSISRDVDTSSISSVRFGFPNMGKSITLSDSSQEINKKMKMSKFLNLKILLNTKVKNLNML